MKDKCWGCLIECSEEKPCPYDMEIEKKIDEAIEETDFKELKDENI